MKYKKCTVPRTQNLFNKNNLLEEVERNTLFLGLTIPLQYHSKQTQFVGHSSLGYNESNCHKDTRHVSEKVII